MKSKTERRRGALARRLADVARLERGVRTAGGSTYTPAGKPRRMRSLAEKLATARRDVATLRAALEAAGVRP